MQVSAPEKITFAEWQKTNRQDARLIRELLTDCFKEQYERYPSASELVALCDEVVNRKPESLSAFIELARHEHDMDELYRFG